jgi:hypothetical protein
VSLVPQARTGPGTRDPIELIGALEEQVARLAAFVLNLWALAERYEDAMGRIAPSKPTFADQQTRVDTLRAAAERGRSRLVFLGREA